MGDRLHVGTMLWGLVLTIWGAAMLGVGVGWWDLELVDLRYAGPILIIIVGAVIVFGALAGGDSKTK